MVVDTMSLSSIQTSWTQSLRWNVSHPASTDIFYKQYSHVFACSQKHQVRPEITKMLNKFYLSLLFRIRKYTPQNCIILFLCNTNFDLDMNFSQCRRVGNIFRFRLCLLRPALCHQPTVQLQAPRAGNAPGPRANQLPLLWNHPHKEWEEQACWTLWCYTYSLVGINDI